MIGLKGRIALLGAALVVFGVAVYMASIRDFGAAVAVGCTALFFAIWALGAGVTEDEQEKVSTIWVESSEPLYLPVGERLMISSDGKIWIETDEGVRFIKKNAVLGVNYELV
jgi:hypothetical protein